MTSTIGGLRALAEAGAGAAVLPSLFEEEVMRDVAAHQAMESITMDREVMHLRDSLIPKYAEIVYYGFWFSPEMRLLQNMIDMTQQNVSGTVRLELYKGNCRILGRKSDRSLYREDFATFEDDDVYSHKDAEGFIRLNALRLRIKKMLEQNG